MSPKRIEYLLGLVGPLIQTKDTNLSKAIPATERLTIFHIVTSLFQEECQSHCK